MQLGLTGLQLTERHPDGRTEVTTIDGHVLGPMLRDQFGLALDDDELDRLRRTLEP